MSDTKSKQNNKRHFCLIGYRGSGKSYLTQLVKQRFLGPLRPTFFDIIIPLFFSLDNLCEEYMKESIHSVVETKGWSFFRQVEKNQLKSILQSKNPIFLDCGGGVVEDRENCVFIKEKSWVIFIDTPIYDLIARQLKNPRPSLTVDNKSENIQNTRDIAQEIHDETKTVWQKRLPLYRENADLILSNTDKKNFEVLFSFILEKAQKNTL